MPRGWAVEQRMKADLDADKSPDEVLVLLQEERTDVDRQRALIVLLRRAQGFALGGKNVGLLPPWGGAGTSAGWTGRVRGASAGGDAEREQRAIGARSPGVDACREGRSGCSHAGTLGSFRKQHGHTLTTRLPQSKR
ncbi:MAG: hypothetical protein ABI895_10970 [Deltaproteobacteria bacterium]